MKRRYKILIVFVFMLCLLFLISSNITHAQTLSDLSKASGGDANEGSTIARFLSWIVLMLTNFFGYLISFLLSWIGTLFQKQNELINTNGLTTGWTAVRDLCNMFFILALLIIAFATILRQENYAMKRMLPKLLIVAVIINFSKTICFLLVDISNIIMMTFADVFVAKTGLFVDLLGIKYINMLSDSGIKLDSWNLFYALALAMVVAGISLIIFIMFTIVLIGRIIALAILIVLSPMAFFLSAVPGGNKYFGQWSGEFSRYLILGPVLAFFTWLALIIANNASALFANIYDAVAHRPEQVNAAVSAIGESDNLMAFVLSAGILIAALRVSQGIGGIGAGVGMNLANRVKSQGLSMARSVGRTAKKTALKTAMAPVAGGKAIGGFVVDKLQEKQGIDFNLARVWKGVQSQRKDIKQRRYQKGQQAAQNKLDNRGRFLTALSLTGSPEDAWEQIWSKKGRAQLRLGGRKSEELRLEAAKKADAIEDRKKSREKMRDTLVSESEVAGLRKNLTDENAKKTKLDGDIRAQDAKLTLAKVQGDKKKEEEATKKLEELRKTEEKLNTTIENLQKELGDKSSRAMRDDKFKTTKAKYDALIAGDESELSSAKDEVQKYSPFIHFEARSAGRKLVGEQMAKLKDIDDADELIGIWQQAFEEKNKAMMEATMTKMSQNGDENEYLKKLVGSTDSVGLQHLMKAMSGDKDFLAANPQLAHLAKAGFSQQEAYTLGNDLSIVHKGTNHWAATGGFKIKNGVWDTADEKEINQYRAVETGKLDNQKILRNLGRLAYGKHDSTGKFHLDAGGINLLKKLDNPKIIDAIGYNLNESAAKHLVPYVDELVNKGIISSDLSKAIHDRVKGMPTLSEMDKDYEKCKILADELSKMKT